MPIISEGHSDQYIVPLACHGMNNEPIEARRETLALDLRGLGIKAGDIVMLHAAFRSVRPVEGGPDPMIDAIMDVVTTAGGLVMFASWEHSTYDAFVAGGDAQLHSDPFQEYCFRTTQSCVLLRCDTLPIASTMLPG